MPTSHRAHSGHPEDVRWPARVLLGNRIMLMIATAVTLALAVVAASSPAWLLRFDEPISEWIRGQGEYRGLFSAVTQLGSPNLAVGLAVAGAVPFWRRCRAAAVTIMVLVVGGLVVDLSIKLLVDRPRPPQPLIDTALGSFPSGHVIHSVIILGFIPFLLWALTGRRRLLQVGTAVFAVGVFAVALSRVRLGAHWPSDVFVSFLLGLTLLLAAEQLLMSVWAADRCAATGLHRVELHELRERRRIR